MSGQKKKNQATTAKAPKTDAKYADAIGWESSRLSLAEKSEARAWLTAKILGATNIALVAAIVIMILMSSSVTIISTSVVPFFLFSFFLMLCCHTDRM